MGPGEVEWWGRSDSSCSNRIRVGRSGSQAPDPWCLEAIVMLSSSGWGRAPRLRGPHDCGGRDRPSFPSLAENEVSGWEGGVRLEGAGGIVRLRRREDQ